MGESGTQPDVPAGDGQSGAAAPDTPVDDGADEALDDALRELFAESRAEDRRESPVVLMSWCRGFYGLL
jgi:hypothetical protein